MLRKVCLTAAFIAIVAAPASSHADDKDVIEYRQHIMKTLQEQTAIIGELVSGAAPAENLRYHAETISLAAKLALSSFQAKVPGGQSKPEVWAKWDDFSKRMNSFVENAGKFSDAAKGGASITDITAILVEALPCKECHDLYRDEK